MPIRRFGNDAAVDRYLRLPEGENAAVAGTYKRRRADHAITPFVGSGYETKVLFTMKDCVGG